MIVPRPSIGDSCIVAASGSLVALGLFNMTLDAHAWNPWPNPDLMGVHDYQHFAPTRGVIKARESARFGEPGEFREFISEFIWETNDRCDGESRLWNFCEGSKIAIEGHPTDKRKDQVFEYEIWLNNYRDGRAGTYRWAKENVASIAPIDTMAIELPYPYVDIPALNSENEFDVTGGTVHADYILPNVWYAVNILSRSDKVPEFPGGNWVKLRFAVGDRDADWFSGYPCDFDSNEDRAGCMLQEDDDCVVFSWLDTEDPAEKKVLPGRIDWTLSDRDGCKVYGEPD